MTDITKGIARPKKRAARSSSDDEADQVLAKKAKTITSGPPKKKSDSDGNAYWELSQKNRISIQAFKGKTYINIREYYEKDGQSLPGKKGIMLPPEQFATIIAALPQVEELLAKRDVQIPRPRYDGASPMASADNSNIEDDEKSEDALTPRKKRKGKASQDDDEGDDDD